MVVSPVVTAVVSLVGLCGVLAWRVREGRSAVTVKKLVMPPVGMATGFSMFVMPMFRVPLTWALAAFAIGAVVLAYPLLLTSSLRREGDAIMMKRSSAFFAVVIVLAAVRYFARGYLDKYLTLEQTGGLFFVLAFGMILRWRMKLLSLYMKLTGPDGALQVAPEEAAISE
ncbi:MAG: cytochrome c biogenesis protein CcdC [Acidobacteriota bacterium]|nr:cytochrome c biogenesis protein CcdC [Acidobacteriota bacterium]MDE3162529.1 cytochrome c biogenesis protein CcdC [Acidobacteriota bacterium]